MASKWPPLPRTVRGTAGPIRIKQILRPHDGKENAWGTWEMATRTIHIAKRAQPAQKWRVLYHELAHATLDDSGIANLLSREGEEALCDAIAASRLQEMRGTLGLNE